MKGKPMYVVDTGPKVPVTVPGQVDGLRRSDLAYARETARLFLAVPMHGRIIDAETLEVVEEF